MPVVVSPRVSTEGSPVPSGQSLVLDGLSWDSYVAINDALTGRPSLRMHYHSGRLVIVVTSRRHDWYAETLGHIFRAVATAFELDWEEAGRATYRRADSRVGAEADETFYLGEHAELMAGPTDVDLATQPPPDVVIEVELTHSADDALMTWGKIGVPEIWRFDPNRWRFVFCHRQEDGTYQEDAKSWALPALTATDVLEQLKQADMLGKARWFASLTDWARAVIVPRRGLRP